MRGLNMFLFLLLLLGWRRYLLCFASSHFLNDLDEDENEDENEYFNFGKSDDHIDDKYQDPSAGNSLRISWLSSKVHRHKMIEQHQLKHYFKHKQMHHHHHHGAAGKSLSTTKPPLTLPPLRKSHNKLKHSDPNGPPDKEKFRHSNRFLDKFYEDMDAKLREHLVDSKYNLDNMDFNVTTISQLIWNLRGMRARRRRSSQAALNQTVVGKFKRVNNITWPLKKVGEIPGEIWLGGLMMVHEREDKIICGPIMPQGGIQALETMMYTIDKINDQQDFLPGIKIGAHILDDCDKDTYGLEQAVDFIKGSISNIDDVDFSAKCSDGVPPVTRKNKVIAGVVGAASSVTSIQVANLLRLFKIPQVSFFSTSPELSNKQRFEFFSRTIPSDKNQVQAMIEIVRKFGWSYVSIIYEESNYGLKAFEELEKILPEYNICIAAKEKLVKDSGVAEEASYEKIVEKLLAVSKAKGVIIFGSDQEVKDLMRAVRKRNATGSFTWIGSDGWSARRLVSDGNEREVEGTLSVQPMAKPVQGFDKYFFNLNVKNNTRNPWFVEFWEHQFGCKYSNSTKTPYNQNYNSTCTGDETLTMNNTQFEAQLQYVSDAVMAFAYAFKDMHNVVCNGTRGVCSAMDPVDGTELLNYLKKVKFVGLSGDDFHFDSFQDGPARYNIIHFRRIEGTEPPKYNWTNVGEYNEGVLTLNMSAVQFADGSSNPPISVCSDPCGEGEAKRYLGGDTCCWSCIKCLDDEIRAPGDESRCFTCPLGTFPDVNHTACIPIEEEYLRYSDSWAIGAMTFAGVGILLTAAVVGVFINFNDTPVVRASGRELSYVLLFGLLFCYALTFLFIIRPNDIICGVQQFCTGFCFTLVYAALLTKTNRIARIFQAGRRSARRPSFISPRSQLVICSLLISIQVLIMVVWMLLQPPKAMYHHPARKDNFLVCQSYINDSYSIAFAYPLSLIVVCTIYAILTRKIPEAFNESKYIGFTMYTTCIIWLAFVPIYFSTANQVALRITSMTVAISLSATVMVACLFAPKLYIIIFHPERNIRQSMMPATRFSAVTSNTGGNPSSVNATPAAGAPPTSIPMTAIMKPNHLENFSNAQKRVQKDCGTQSDENDVIQNGRGRQLNSIHPSVVVSQSTCSTQTDFSDASLSCESAMSKNCNQNEYSGSEYVEISDLPSASYAVAESIMMGTANHPQPHRVTFKTESQIALGNQHRNSVIPDGKSVTIIVANDGDVLL